MLNSRKRKMKTLIAYFSAEGTTAKLAKALAESMAADLFEIMPEKPYSAADLKWTNPLARCNREKMGKKDVPVQGKINEFEQYDLIILGFPIWYYSAPNVVNTFCKGYDWTGKNIGVFATSGGSEIGKTIEKLQSYVKGGSLLGGKVVKNEEELAEWIDCLR